MNILFTLNDAFVPQVATCMCSLFENNKSAENITVYLIGERISEENQNKLKGFAKSYDRKVCIISINNIADYIDFDFDTNGWSSIILARLFLDKLLPQEVDRILYLDGDTLVLKDLGSLFYSDLGDKVIGMA